MSELTHFDSEGKAIMVDVGEKENTRRVAVARGEVRMQPETLARILENKVEKGDVFAVARLAGIMAAKKTSELIPLCHPLLLNSVTVEFTPDRDNASIGIEATVKVNGPTGVEMEALTAVSVAALTIYDMCKAVDKAMTIDHVRLAEKKVVAAVTLLTRGSRPSESDTDLYNSPDLCFPHGSGDCFGGRFADRLPRSGSGDCQGDYSGRPDHALGGALCRNCVPPFGR